jgi:GWxTD domain-containing protein
MQISRFLLFTISCILSFGALAQSGQLKAYIDQKAFYSPVNGPIIEINYQFIGYTLRYTPSESGLQAKLAIQTVITNLQGDTVNRDAYVLMSPVMRDSIIEDFYDIQRLALQPGNYKAHLSLTDLNSTAVATTGTIDIKVPDWSNSPSISDVFVTEAAIKSTVQTIFSKSGYEMLPRLSNFYGQDLNSLPFYVELYNTNMLPDSVFGLKQRIISTTDQSEQTGYTKFTKLKTTDVVPFLRNIDISKLPTGSYRLMLELIDKNNQQIGTASSYYFERVNEIENEISIENIVLDPGFQQSISDDSLKFYLASLIPIARPAENKLILQTLKSNDLEKYRKHLQQFWVQTSGANAANAWLNYKKQVLMVQHLYSNNFQDGYETDRGRVYLQYGPPSMVIQRETSPTEYPYEIWQYDKIKMFSNKRFVFYNPDLVNNTYRLLHSDMVGELKTPNWQQYLTKRNNQSNDQDSGVPSTYGGNSNSYFKQF